MVKCLHVLVFLGLALQASAFGSWQGDACATCSRVSVEPVCHYVDASFLLPPKNEETSFTSCDFEACNIPTATVPDPTSEGCQDQAKDGMRIDVMVDVVYVTVESTSPIGKELDKSDVLREYGFDSTEYIAIALFDENSDIIAGIEMVQDDPTNILSLVMQWEDPYAGNTWVIGGASLNIAPSEELVRVHGIASDYNYYAISCFYGRSECLLAKEAPAARRRLLQGGVQIRERRLLQEAECVGGWVEGKFSGNNVYQSTECCLTKEECLAFAKANYPDAKHMHFKASNNNCVIKDALDEPVTIESSSQMIVACTLENGAPCTENIPAGGSGRDVYFSSCSSTDVKSGESCKLTCSRDAYIGESSILCTDGVFAEVISPKCRDTCFPGDSVVIVQTTNGPVNRRMEDVAVGDVVLTGFPATFEPVVFVGHPRNDRALEYVVLETKAKAAVRLTGAHLIYLGDSSGSKFGNVTVPSFYPVRADSVVVGDKLVLSSGVATPVVAIRREIIPGGAYTFVTPSRRFIVDEILCSSHASGGIDGKIAFAMEGVVHACFAPIGGAQLASRFMRGVASLFYALNQHLDLNQFKVDYMLSFVSWGGQ